MYPFKFNWIKHNNLESFSNTKYIEFGGTDEYLYANTNIILSGKFAISFWMNTSLLTNNYIFGKKVAGDNYLRISTNTLLRFVIDGYNIYFNKPSGYPSGTWDNYIFSRNSSNDITLHINASLVDTVNATGDCTIGIIGRSAPGYFIGSLDEYSLFSDELTQAQKEYSQN